MSLVLLDVVRPLGRHIRVGENRLDRTFGLTGTTVDALVWVDVELVGGVVNAVHRAHLDATRVLGLDARLSDDVGHDSDYPFVSLCERQRRTCNQSPKARQDRPQRCTNSSMATYGSHAASALAPDSPGKNSMQAFQALAVIPTVVVIAVAAGGQSVRKQEGIVYGSVYDSTMGEPVARVVVDVIRSQNIPGIIARHRSDGSVCVGYSTGQVRMMFDTGCLPMLVFLNGAPVSNTEMVYQLPPDAVDRLMIYKPLEAGNLFGLGAGNGVILIYRKGN